MSTITAEVLSQLHVSIPRYTSYPTAPTWKAFSGEAYLANLEKMKGTNETFSLYIHIPFCKTMCLFCGCSVVLNRDEKKEIEYVKALCSEIKLLANSLGRKKISQLHLGGGTPTKLSSPLLKILLTCIKETFEIDFNGEIAIEIDPRTVFADKEEKLKVLRELGFNRVSFGVQDTNEEVQRAIKRNQTLQMTQETFYQAKALGFHGINIDLIYGLPFQTLSSFSHTIEHIVSLKPDRIALFSYAKVPWLKPHQKAIQDSSLPTTEEKFVIYSHAREALIKNGYIAIGMDHFSLPEDELAKSYYNKTLQRNFQGYTVKRAENQIGLGITAIGGFKHFYAQNEKTLSAYYSALEKGQFPTARGQILSHEDLLRKQVIQTLMCDFFLDKKLLEKQYALSFDTFFFKEKKQLEQLEKLHLLKDTPNAIVVTQLGELFIRNIASCFDQYLSPNLQFSKSI